MLLQFHNQERLTEIHAKENRRIEWEWRQKNESKEEGAPEQEEPPALTQEEMDERERLNAEGFSNWSRKEFLALTKAMEKWGRDDLENVAKEVEGKTLEEVQKYSVAFWCGLLGGRGWALLSASRVSFWGLPRSAGR